MRGTHSQRPAARLWCVPHFSANALLVRTIKPEVAAGKQRHSANKLLGRFILAAKIEVDTPVFQHITY